MTAIQNTTHRLLEHLTRYRDGTWDAQSRRRTQVCLIDSLTCYSVGRTLEHHAPNVAVAHKIFAPGRVDPSAFAAAYLYGQAANALDYDDTLIGHPGAPIVGAVLAAAARDNLSTDRLLRGIAAGYEAHWQLAASAIPSPERAVRVRSVGVWDTLASSLAVGVALDLTDEVLERVIGIAAAHSLIPYTGKWYERPVPALKNNLGWAAAGAILSVDLALEGQTGITSPLDGDNGMWAMAGSDRWQSDSTFSTKPGVLRVGFKHYPACWHLQEYLKTMSAALEQLTPGDDVSSVLVSGPSDVEKFSDDEITTPADVAFSLPATISLLASGVEPGPLWDSFDTRSEQLSHRTKVTYQQSSTRSLSVHTASGQIIELPVDTSDRFDPAPWGLDETGVLDKHTRLTEPGLRGDTLRTGPDDGVQSDLIPRELYAAVRETMTPVR